MEKFEKCEADKKRETFAKMQGDSKKRRLCFRVKHKRRGKVHTGGYLKIPLLPQCGSGRTLK